MDAKTCCRVSGNNLQHEFWILSVKIFENAISLCYFTVQNMLDLPSTKKGCIHVCLNSVPWNTFPIPVQNTIQLTSFNPSITYLMLTTTCNIRLFIQFPALLPCTPIVQTPLTTPLDTTNICSPFTTFATHLQIN